MTKYFHEIEVGATYRSAGRTLIESDIVNFAGLTGDFNPLHIDEEWVRNNTSFPSRIAHGLLVQSIGEGLSCPGVNDWNILAFLDVQRQMKAPIFPGNRIQQKYKVVEKRPSSKDPSRGIVTVEVEIVNEKGQIVQKGRNIYMIGGKESNARIEG